MNKKATRQKNQKFQREMLHPNNLPEKENFNQAATRPQNQKFQKGKLHPDNLPKKENVNCYYYKGWSSSRLLSPQLRVLARGSTRMTSPARRNLTSHCSKLLNFNSNLIKYKSVKFT